MSDSIKAIYISYDGLTDPLGQSQVLPYIIQLSRKGIQFYLLTYDKKERMNQKKRVEDLKTLTEANRIEWISLRYHKKLSLVATTYDILRGIFLTRSLIKRDSSIRIAHCRGYVSALIGLYLKSYHGLRFIFDMRGFWPEEKTDGGAWSANGLVYRFAKYFEKKYFHQADSIVILTQAGKHYIRDHPEQYQPATEIHVIPTAVDLELFKFDPAVKSDRQHFFEHTPPSEWDLRLVYSGSIGSWYKPREMIRFFACLKQVFPHAVFTFLTNNPEKKDYLLKLAHEIESEIPAPGLSQSLVIVSAAYTQLPEYLNRMDCCISFIEPCFSKISSFPTKFGETLACGLPQIINPGIGDTAQIVENEQIGFLITDFSLQAYQDAARQMDKLVLTHPDYYLRCRKIAGDYLDLARHAVSFYTIYTRLCPANLAGEK